MPKSLLTSQYVFKKIPATSNVVLRKCSKTKILDFKIHGRTYQNLCANVNDVRGQVYTKGGYQSFTIDNKQGFEANKKYYFVVKTSQTNFEGASNGLIIQVNYPTLNTRFIGLTKTDGLYRTVVYMGNETPTSVKLAMHANCVEGHTCVVDDFAVYAEDTYQLGTDDIDCATVKEYDKTGENPYKLKINHFNYGKNDVVLPNGVADTIEIINGVKTHVKRVAYVKLADLKWRLNASSTYLQFLSDGLNRKPSNACGDIISNITVLDNGYGGIVTPSIVPNLQSGSYGKDVQLRLALDSGITEDNISEFLADKYLYYEANDPVYTEIDADVVETVLELPVPLRSLPNGVCDTIEGNKLIKRIGNTILTGAPDEKWILFGQNSRFIESETIAEFAKPLSSIWCDTLPENEQSVSVEHNPKGIKIYDLSEIRLKPFDKDDMTLEEALDWLSKNPTTIYFELKEPIVYDLSVPTMYTVKGPNTITTDNTIKPGLSMRARTKR